MSSVTGRIFARKVALVYLYQRLFLARTANKPSLLREVVAIDHYFLQQDKWNEEVRKLGESLERHEDTIEKDMMIEYIVAEYFTKADEIDMQYVDLVTEGYDEFASQMAGLIDPYTTSFPYNQMDAMTQALFVLGYSERKYLKTPSKIILNELVELSKRYGVNGAPRLINAIGHKLFAEAGDSE